MKHYADGFAAVNNVSLDIEDGEFVTLVGPSGCGKSTILRMIAGLEDVSSGEVLIAGERVNEQPPRTRNLAMVFQNYALYPHLSVFENIAFPLRLSRERGKQEIRGRVEQVAKLLELTDLLDRRPSQLSGGQRQRVAMGRAMVRDARAFLFDEPLSNLDAKLRGQMRTEIGRLQRKLRFTTVYVTHDQIEAMTLGERVAVLHKGVLQQVGQPREIYECPVNLFVAGFIGSPPMNFVPATVSGGIVSLPFASVELSREARERIGGRDLVVAGIRPECFEEAHLVPSDERDQGVSFKATVDLTEWLGNVQFAYVPFEAQGAVSRQLKSLASDLGSESSRTQLTISLDAESRVRGGHPVEFWFAARRMHLFDPASGLNLTRPGQA